MSSGKYTGHDLNQAQMNTLQAINQSFHLCLKNIPYKGNCLSQSLTLWWLLKRQDIIADIRIGVSQKERHLHAHAWLEYNNIPINEHPDVYNQYAAFDAALQSEALLRKL